jgi:hypothetical protein
VEVRDWCSFVAYSTRRRLEFAFEMDRFFTLKDWANRWLEMQLIEIMLMELVQK